MIGASYFFMTLAGTISTALCGYLANVFQASANPIVYGKILAGVCCTANVLSIPFFYLAGKAYK